MKTEAAYPKRPAYFAHRVVRLAFKTCLAQEIGPTATMLVIFVAHTEDAKHYTAPPTFFNEQLLPILGLRKWDALDNARRAAVAAGWLHYQPPPSGTRRSGIYWTCIPERFAGIDDSPSDEHHDHIRETDTVDGQAYPPNGYGAGDGAGDGGGEPSIPVPNPVPKKARALKTSALDGFAEWWTVYPHKVAKLKAQDAYAKALKRIVAADTLDQPGAVAKLLAAVKAFAASEQGRGEQQYIPYPATWLNAGRYDDAPATAGSNGKAAEPKRRYL
jgi:hypothetical protein